MFLSDHLTLDAPKRTQDGYMAVRARAARTGAYAYSGRDVDPENKHGLRDEATVHVLRDAEEVFAERAVRSFLMKPITNDHPTEAVTADNWKRHAGGVVAKAMRDGDHLAFDLVLMDAEAIQAVDSGKRELSNGYRCELEFGDFTAADGTKCAARQVNITGNHVALVDRGRAGPTCRIADAAPCDAAPFILDSLKTEKPVKTMLIDGLTVDIANADTAEATIKTILAARDAALDKVATLTTDKATLETEKATLTQQLSDAKITPQQMRDAAKAYALTAGKAKALGVAVTDAMDEQAIMAATVHAKMGDAANGWNDAQIAASFAVLAKDAKVSDADPLRAAIAALPVVDGVDPVADRNKRKAALSDAWRTPFNAADAAAAH